MKFLKDNALLLSLAMAVVIAGTSLMMVSQKVYDKQRHVRSLDQQILTNQWDIRALKAELAFLTRPDRLDQITAAVAQNETSKGVSDGFAPVTFIYDLPPSMSLLPPNKPEGAIYHRTSVTQAPAPQKDVTKAPKPQPEKQSGGFSSLLDTLGGGQ